MSVEFRAAVTVSEMAKMLGMSRSRLYQLIDGGVFPAPSYCVSTRRPIFADCQQRRCLDVKRSGRGVSGRPVVFYSKTAKARRSPPDPKRPASEPHADILAGVRGLGLSAVNAPQVEMAVKSAFPSGTAGVAEGEIIRSVFLHLVRQSRAST